MLEIHLNLLGDALYRAYAHDTLSPREWQFIAETVDHLTTFVNRPELRPGEVVYLKVLVLQLQAYHRAMGAPVD